MGVTCVCQVPVAEGKSVQQTVDILHKKLEQLGALKQGSFWVDCETYQSTGNAGGQPSKLLYVMHNSEVPLSCMALFEGGPCLTADTNFDVLMVKLKSHFQNAKGHKVECRGSRYRYCDFLIKVGTVTMSSSARGISVEVEYCPCVVPGDCWNLMREFIQSFLGSNVPELPTVFAAKPEGLFAPADCVDTMTQYLELFNKLRKSQIPGSNINFSYLTPNRATGGLSGRLVEATVPFARSKKNPSFGLLFHVATVGGRKDGPSCCLLFSRGANESPAAAQSRSNESSGVWARF
ncbi:mediator complex subunit Med20 [Crenichthys baileyi]|uniref:Mediator of RNA polymerase II transcription subunit 20 n=1 Tax=Crenichthys baileyi TaxID=28760 RepID=A0AAV9S0F8_9TELE